MSCPAPPVAVCRRNNRLWRLRRPRERASSVSFCSPPAIPNGTLCRLLQDGTAHIAPSSERRKRLICIGELHNLVADIVRPDSDTACEGLPVIGEQRSGRFLEIRKIAGHRRHEMIGG